MSEHDALVDRIRALADALRADLRTTGEPFSVECVALGTTMDLPRVAIEWAGQPVPEWLPVMISIGHPDGGRGLVFSAEGNFADQVTAGELRRGRGELAARSGDVPAAGEAHRRAQAMLLERVAERVDGLAA